MPSLDYVDPSKSGYNIEFARKRVYVAYPIATAANSANNPTPGQYAGIAIYPYTPFGINSSMPNVDWGGLPWISYAPDFKEPGIKGTDKTERIPIPARNRAIAFHSPIDVVNGMMHLTRGPVSHGCNRMQGEHVVEMAQLLGADMSANVSKDYSANKVFEKLEINVTVLEGIDNVKEEENFRGMAVDVDYAAEPSVRRPSESVMMFKPWKGGEQPNWVYAIKP